MAGRDWTYGSRKYGDLTQPRQRLVQSRSLSVDRVVEQVEMNVAYASAVRAARSPTSVDSAMVIAAP